MDYIKQKANTSFLAQKYIYDHSVRMILFITRKLKIRKMFVENIKQPKKLGVTFKIVTFKIVKF